MIRSLSRTQLVVDVVAACVLLLVVIWAPVASSPFGGVVAVLLLCGALAVRRLSPALALIGVWVASLIQIATLQAATPADVATLGVLYATAAYGGRIVRWLGLASAGAGGIIAAVYLSVFARNGYLAPVTDFSRWILIVVVVSIALVTLLGLSWTLGLLSRTVRQSREAKANAAASAQRAAYESAIEQERTRIARDMHDVVAHSLAVVIAQADGARYAGGDASGVQSDALATISTTARSALTEVRLLLTRLRQEVPDGPQPSLDDLPALLAGMRQAGMRVVESTSGSPTPLLQGSGLAGYRILQEALTNALRHGDPARQVNVDLRWTADALHIRVRNAVLQETAPTPAGESRTVAGHGLPGMRERAALAGGTLRAGLASGPAPGPGTVYEVTAVLPTAAAGAITDTTTREVLS